MAFPQEHWTRIYSTNVLERLNKEVKRRTDVVGVFPDVPSVIRLVGAVLLEIDDEWQIERRYFSLESMRDAEGTLGRSNDGLQPLTAGSRPLSRNTGLTEKCYPNYTIDRDAIALFVCLRFFAARLWYDELCWLHISLVLKNQDLCQS
jgi:hypothetical protein